MFPYPLHNSRVNDRDRESQERRLGPLMNSVWLKRECFFWAIGAVFLLASCAPPPPLVIKKAGKIHGLEQSYKPGDIVQLPEGKVISFTKLIDLLGQKELVFIGEVHTDSDHHLIQTQILQVLATKWPRLDVAMEFLPVHVQEQVDRFMWGKSSEEEFLSKINWDEIWGYPFHLYRPLFLVVKRERGKILAINAPPKIVKKVARKGLSGLRRDERGLIATEIDLSHPMHRQYLREVFDSHPQEEIKNFEYFYQAQCVWEDTMAENIAHWLMERNGNLVVLTGNGHVLNPYGIPPRVIKRKKVKSAVVVPIHIRSLGRVKPESADFIWVTGSRFMGIHPKR